MRWMMPAAVMAVVVTGCGTSGDRPAPGTAADQAPPSNTGGAPGASTTPPSNTGRSTTPSLDATRDPGASTTPSSDAARDPGASTTPSADAVRDPGASPGVAAAGCKGSPVILRAGFPEVRGTAVDAELWGLLFAKGPPLPRGEEVKIVWRMTGEGPLQVKATLPDGTRATPVWGPEEHGGSNWRRPGQEWGTGFVFPKRGCWKVELTRTRGSGHVWLGVR